MHCLVRYYLLVYSDNMTTKFHDTSIPNNTPTSPPLYVNYDVIEISPQNNEPRLPRAKILMRI